MTTNPLDYELDIKSLSDDSTVSPNLEEVELDDGRGLNNRVTNIFLESPGSPPELTLRAVLLGFILCVILSSANIYIGLKVGLTVSASIPAAVLSAAVLALFRDHNVLENNQVQTAASAGEALAAGIIFTIPTLVMLGYWDHFDPYQVMCISGLGGIIGVLFTIPLRRTLIVAGKLPFPEGVAVAAVLTSVSPTVMDPKAKNKSGGARDLGAGSLLAVLIKISEAGFQLWKEALSIIPPLGGMAVVDISPALIGVGYVVGLPITTLISVGGLFSWWVALPAYYHWVFLPNKDTFEFETIPANVEASTSELLDAIWHEKIRMIGVGAMLVGGLWVVVSMYSALWAGVKGFMWSMVEHTQRRNSRQDRTETDMHPTWIVIGGVLCLFGLSVLYYFVLSQNILITIVVTITMTIFGFIGSAAAGYMAGLVGSSNNPVSGIAVSTVMFSAFIVLLVSRVQPSFPVDSFGPAAAILVASVVCCASAMAGDTLQDLKAGHLLGATPWKQQMMQICGVLISCCVATPVLHVLQHSYGFRCSSLMPTPGTDVPSSPSSPSSLSATEKFWYLQQDTKHVKALAAPQACLMEHLAQGVFGKGLSWNLIVVGAVLAVVVIVVDQVLKCYKSKFRVHLLAVAVGIYLPFELVPPMFLGSFIRTVSQWVAHNEWSDQGGLMCASGLITGEAVTGIFIATISAFKGPEFLVLFGGPVAAGPFLAVLALLLCCYVLLYSAIAGCPHLGAAQWLFPVRGPRRLFNREAVGVVL